MIIQIFWVAFILMVLGAMLYTVRRYLPTPEPVSWFLQGIIVLGILYILCGVIGFVPLPRRPW